MKELAPLLLCVLVGAYLFGSPPALKRSPDVLEYEAFSEAILNGDLFTVRGEDVPKHLATRTPGFPALVAGFRAMGLGAEKAVVVGHALVGLVSLLGVPLLLRRYCPMWLSGPAVLVVLHAMRNYYDWPITEWLSVNLLLWLFAVCVRYVEKPTPSKLLGIGLLASAIILTRPALIVVGVFPLGFALIGAGQRRSVRALIVLASLTPLVAWMAFNAYRLGTFTLTPFAGPNIFGVATVVGHATPQQGDDQEFTRFIDTINRWKKPSVGKRLPLDENDVLRVAKVYNYNIHELAEKLAEYRGYDSVAFNRMLLEYSRRSLLAHPGAYVEYIVFGMRVALRELAPLLITVGVIPVVWLVRRQHAGLAVATLAFLGLHLLHMLLCASAEAVILRYRDLTFSPLLGLSLITGGLFAIGLFRFARERFTPPPEEPALPA
jgi:hypothetical protein